MNRFVTPTFIAKELGRLTQNVTSRDNRQVIVWSYPSLDWTHVVDEAASGRPIVFGFPDAEMRQLESMSLEPLRDRLRAIVYDWHDRVHDIKNRMFRGHQRAWDGDL